MLTEETREISVVDPYERTVAWQQEVMRETREEMERYPDPNDRERARVEERLRLMQEAADRFAAIHAAKKAEWEEEKAREKVHPPGARGDEVESGSELELGYPSSVSSRNKGRLTGTEDTEEQEREEGELFSDDEHDSMPELISMEGEVESYKQCAEWRPPSFAPTNPTSHAVYGSERISPVSDLSALHQFAEIAAGRTPLLENVPSPESRTTTTSLSSAVPATPYSTPAKTTFYRPGTPMPPRVLLDSGAETTISQLAYEEKRSQLQQQYEQLTRDALRTENWQEVHTFNLELNRRLHSSTPIQIAPSTWQLSRDEPTFALKLVSPDDEAAKDINEKSGDMNVPESDGAKESRKREKGKGRLVLAEYSKVDQLTIPMPGESNKNKPIHRQHWSSSTNDTSGNESASSCIGIEPYSPIDLSDVINFGTPPPTVIPVENSESDTESIDAAEFMRLVEQITGRASRAPLPIRDPVNDNPSGFYPWKMYLEEEHMRSRAWECDWAAEPFKRARDIIDDRLDTRLDDWAMRNQPLFTYKPLARRAALSSLYQRGPTPDFTLPANDHQVLSSACIQPDNTVNPRCVEGRCSHETPHHEANEIPQCPLKVPKPRRSKRFRESAALRKTVVCSEALKAAYLANAEIIDNLASARAAVLEGYGRVEDVLIRHKFNFNSAIPSARKHETHPFLYKDEVENLRFAQLILDQDSRYELAGLIGQVLRVRFHDGYAISQLLKAGFLDPSYNPPEDDWDTEMWEVEDEDEGMAVDEFDPRHYEEAACACPDHALSTCPSYDESDMDSDDGKFSPHYPLPDNYGHTFSYHAKGLTALPVPPAL
ncbi:hypothetical protein C8J57DRAFT_1230868 [Mycena rebaudengoi]|nr:hypothetical protein C8J57DRAFT_1230868 [Mycena rebaudengoi]